MTMVQPTTSVTRFNLTQIVGNQIVDWAVIDANYQSLGANAAHLSLGNTFVGNQTVAGNLGLTGVHRRITTPIPAPNETDRLMIMAEGNSGTGTYLGVSAPAGAPSGQRRATLVIHGVEPTGATTPLGMSFSVDEDSHRAAINVPGTFQDLSAPILQLGAGGIDRLSIPGTGAVTVIGNLTLTGNLAAAAGTFSSTLSVTGAAAFGTTVTVTGNTQLNGALDLVGNAVLHSNLSVGTITSASMTLSGNLVVTGTITSGSGGAVVVAGPGTFASLTVSGASTFGGALQFGAGAAYVQPYGADNTFVQISKLIVSPGTTTLTGLTVNGVSTLVGSVGVTGTVDASTGFIGPNGNQAFRARNTSGTALPVMWVDSGNQLVLQAPGAGIRLVNTANSVQWAAWDASGNFTMNTGNLSVAGGITSGSTISSGSQVYTTPVGSLYLRGSDGNVHIDTGAASLYVVGAITANATIQAGGRGIFNGYDAGPAWGMNVGGNAITSGYHYQRARGDCRCWDNFDFNYTSAVAGSNLVQRSAEGYIYANYVNMTADRPGGRPAFVLGSNGDNFGRWYAASAIGPPSGVVGYSVGFNVALPTNWVRLATINLDRQGQWVILVNGRVEGSVGAGYIEYRLLFNGGVAQQYQDDATGNDYGARWYGGICVAGQTFFPPGSWVAIDGWCNFGNQRVSGGLYAYFLSTQDYPN